MAAVTPLLSTDGLGRSFGGLKAVVVTRSRTRAERRESMVETKLHLAAHAFHKSSPWLQPSRTGSLIHASNSGAPLTFMLALSHSIVLPERMASTPVFTM